MSEQKFLGESDSPFFTFKFYDDGDHLDYLVEIVPKSPGNTIERLRFRADIAAHALNAGIFEPINDPKIAEKGKEKPLDAFEKSMMGKVEGILSSLEGAVPMKGRVRALETYVQIHGSGKTSEFMWKELKAIEAYINTGEFPKD